AMRDQWAAGTPCDVLILSAKLLDDLAGDGAIDARVALGRVRTGVAVPSGSVLPPIADGDELRRAFLAATSLYLPDPQRATARIQCVEVLQRWGFPAGRQPGLRRFPKGAGAVAGFAPAVEERPIGCTQVTEILYTPGVTLVGAFPAGFELNT